MLVRTREGRVVKVEGNPAHPISRGGLCALGQSSVQGLYDPDRVHQPLQRHRSGALTPIAWTEAIQIAARAIAEAEQQGKETLLLSSPLPLSERSLALELLGKTKQGNLVEYQLLDRQILDHAAELCFGKGIQTHFDFSQAEVILSLGADYLGTWLSPVEFTRQFAANRVPGPGRLLSYAVQIEPRLSLTAANADRWIINRPGSEAGILEAILSAVLDRDNPKRIPQEHWSLLRAVWNGKTLTGSGEQIGIEDADLQDLVKRLLEAPTSLVVAGSGVPSDVGGLRAALICNLLNLALGNIGGSVLLQPRAADAARFETVERFFKSVSHGKRRPGVLLLHRSNPVFEFPPAAGFEQLFEACDLTIALATHLDESSSKADLVLPLSTPLETWSDAKPAPGIFNLSQPVMTPLYQTQGFGDTLLDIFAAEQLNKPLDGVRSFLEYLKAQWQKRKGAEEGGFERLWRRFVEQGGEFGLRELAEPALMTHRRQSALKQELVVRRRSGESNKLVFAAFPTVHYFDGRASNRPWLQEIPDPLTSAVWSSWLELHPDTAAGLGLCKGDIARVSSPAGRIELPVYLTTHIHRQLAAAPIGLGHQGFGRYCDQLGANPLQIIQRNDGCAVCPVRQLDATGVNIEKVGRDDQALVLLQGSDSQHGREIFRAARAADLTAGSTNGARDSAYVRLPRNEERHEHRLPALGPRPLPKQMYRQHPYPQYHWGMVVDLAKCTGCSACVAACYAENNIPISGKTLCSQGREMFWLRIDRFFDGPPDHPVLGFMPVMCQHCDNAPCEPVCPVYATYHNEEGLNAMVYNRCVGTRYCSNNCSYKVRRFNWFHFSWPEPLNWQLNPDVTVRSVGVMEKCTFCVQRIREAENAAKDQGREVRDGEVLPACASSCPAGAIRFGNLLDLQSEAARELRSSRVYKVLDSELNTQPAVGYLAKVIHDD